MKSTTCDFNCRTPGLGYLNLEQLQNLADFLHARSALRNPLTVDPFFTNTYRQP